MSKKREPKLDIEVWADWNELGKPTLMGKLSSLLSRGNEIFSFQYDNAWLDSKHAVQLDPNLELFKGEQFNSSESNKTFGLFLDSSPDRWGRTLQRRRATIQARLQNQPAPKLYESDYLLGVYDGHRLGALRFRIEGEEVFLNNDQDLSTPPMTSIRELEEAVRAIESDSFSDEKEEAKWLKMLIAPGGSLGGARPKASILAPDEQLWIAKFPSREDVQDNGAWEYLVHQLAMKSEITVPKAQLKLFKGPQHTFLIERFDRIKNKRIHFASAMTLLNKTDGAGTSDGTSYLDLAEFIMKAGAQVDQDLLQLWKRIVFHICISNTDDHLRNHGFLLTPKGWVLSPAFDINPNPDGEGLTLNISESDNSQNFELVLEVAPYFRIDKALANKILKKIISEVKHWKTIAKALKISRSEVEKMKNAFRLVED